MKSALCLASAVALLCVPQAEARQMTSTERQRLVSHLEMIGPWFIDEIRGLTSAQLAYKRSPQEWSIAEIIDHILVVGPIYWDDLQRAVKSPPDRRETANSDADILWYGIDRTNRETARPTETPQGRFRDLPGAIDEYTKVHERLLQYVRTTSDDLRAHHVGRQGSDAYQWVLLISTHEQRHILQIRQMKAAYKSQQ
jgi:hypothetical protein